MDMEIAKRAVKYLLIVFIVAASTNYIVNDKLNYCEVIMISVVAGSIYAIVDMYSPSVNIKTVINKQAT